MRATFRNAAACEYEDILEGAAKSASPARRCVYASWHPDLLKLTVFWVQHFKERVEATDFICKVRAEAETAGERTARKRDELQERLKDVTDFVVVWTPAYYNHQKQLQDLSELSWMIESTTEAERRAIWVAALQKFSLKKMRLGEIDLEAQSTRWHSTRSDTDLLMPFNFPDPQNPAQVVAFLNELDDAVERISNHNEGCTICGKLRGN
jgi:hypothetical protein